MSVPQAPPKRIVRVACTQFESAKDVFTSAETNEAKAVELIRQAAAQGANIVLTQEFFEHPYFCIDQDFTLFSFFTHSAETHPMLKRMEALAGELHVVLIVPFVERAGNVLFNSVCIIDADGKRLGVYRKTHMPQNPGYNEKFYFALGQEVKVWDTQFGRIGVGICWDQWFPELARSMCLKGAELLFYPSCIGSMPDDPTDLQPHWTATQTGHAAANVTPLIANNRIGQERSRQDENHVVTYFGSSFIANHMGVIEKRASRDEEAVLVHEFDLNEVAGYRWASFFRDRRVELYEPLLTQDGRVQGNMLTRHINTE
eukprot:gnl/Trimastix_PCT/1049.p1 GENE.gnl/Trimastix_PCT/1049~~gnl/Trimastix_PCT/1049.p1  ORF type:complete len:315 (+),score=107.97 gnl/Trimastix_PCT/1049:35-979(+)